MATAVVDSEVSFSFVVNTGYKFVSINFVPNNSLNVGILEQNITGEVYSFVFKDFTTSGKISIVIEKQIFNLEVLYAEFDERTNTIEEKINILETNVRTNTRSIEILTVDVAADKSNIASLQSSVTNIESQIGNIGTLLDNINGETI